MSDKKTKDELIAAACSAQKNAYAPYSRFHVGAALLAANGKIYQGTNVENASYPLTCCAERSAVYHAVSLGERDFVGLAVVTDNGGTPCGGCRQVLAEFAPEMPIYICTSKGEIVDETTPNALLPSSFKPKDLVS